jgi:hypothetical protein
MRRRKTVGAGALVVPLLIAAGIVGAGCGRSNDASGHNTYQSQPGGTDEARQSADTARDSAAPRVAP